MCGYRPRDRDRFEREMRVWGRRFERDMRAMGEDMARGMGGGAENGPGDGRGRRWRGGWGPMGCYVFDFDEHDARRRERAERRSARRERRRDARLDADEGDPSGRRCGGGARFPRPPRSARRRRARARQQR